tara:strand:- start:22285 stop:22428 length:144 start_codon:yes stop_codon:yes gene_type:complete
MYEGKIGSSGSRFYLYHPRTGCYGEWKPLGGFKLTISNGKIYHQLKL